MTNEQILNQLKDGKISVTDASALLAANAPAKTVDVTQPRLQKDGKLCVMAGTTLTAYQLVRTKEVCDQLLAIVQKELSGAERKEEAESPRANKDGTKDTYTKHYSGSLLVAYKPEHVAHVKAYFTAKKA